MSLRIGILGGTFDPIHLGHLLPAETARSRLGLDRVLFVPALVPPHKDSVETAPETRYRMTDLACRENEHFEASDLELRREGPSYTVDTLRTLRRESPAGSEHFLLMGADSASELETWKDFREILSHSTLVVLSRKGAGDLPEPVSTKATVLHTPIVEISSTEIRELVRKGGSIRYLVPDSVESFIRSERLYLS